MAAEQRPGGGDGLGIVIVPLLLCLGVWAIWHFNRAGLYYYSAKMAYYMLWPGQFVSFVADYRRQILVDVLHKPDPLQVIVWVNAAWFVPATLFSACCLWLAKKRWSHPIVRMKGSLSVDALISYQAQIHSPIAPIAPIARDLHRNLDPRWHESYKPYEAIEKFGLHIPDADAEPEATPEEEAEDAEDDSQLWQAPPEQADRPPKSSASYPPLVREKVENYFLKQLGRRVYHPGIDAPFVGSDDHSKPGSVCADKFNNYEKAMFALFAPLALKGKRGFDEYYALRDRLNRSAVNSTQTPTLSLANAQYQTYRADPKLNALFERHHFSTTYLMQLFTLAKRAGRVTTAEFLGWLRPNAHNLFVALETVGRKVAFTESGGSYCHWMFEKHCNLKKRTPILPCVTPAVLALEHEWQVHHESSHRETEETIWGRIRNDSRGISVDHELFSRYVKDVLYAGSEKPAPPIAEGEESVFDQEEGTARRQALEKMRAAEDDALRKMMSNQKDLG